MKPKFKIGDLVCHKTDKTRPFVILAIYKSAKENYYLYYIEGVNCHFYSPEIALEKYVEKEKTQAEIFADKMMNKWSLNK